jgi:hypothetical protein
LNVVAVESSKLAEASKVKDFAVVRLEKLASPEPAPKVIEIVPLADKCPPDMVIAPVVPASVIVKSPFDAKADIVKVPLLITIVVSPDAEIFWREKFPK